MKVFYIGPKQMNNNNGKKFKFKWEHAMKEGHKTCLWSPYEKIKIFFFSYSLEGN